MSDGYVVLILVYVDDLITASSYKEASQSIRDCLQKSFRMKDLGEVESFLGVEMTYGGKKALQLTIPTLLEAF